MNTGTNGNQLQKQPVLPYIKSFEIAIKSIKSRFKRSLITTLTLILAISFFNYIQTNSYIISQIFISKDYPAIQKLSQMGFEAPDDGKIHETNSKQKWILFLSLLVCIIGIINTQLMAVTDRFQEIGTMKCLGALDQFVMRLFLIEALLQGFIGAAIGALGGTTISLIGLTARLGMKTFSFIYFNEIAVTICTGILLGSCLSIVGVLYPAFLASRMQPVEAMKGKD